tara:strand:+ start:319 stop:684 length:366 start_codon:yes stop_codon:yes gene_type:complete
MKNESEKLGDNLIKNSHGKGGDMLMTNKRPTYRITTYEDAENLVNPTHKEHNGDLYAVVNILDLEKRLAKCKKHWNKSLGQKRTGKKDYVIFYFDKMSHLQGCKSDDEDIQLGDFILSGEK